MEERSIRKIESTDGKCYVEIVTREDGLFRFVEHTRTTDSGYVFWTPTHWSGLYGDLQTAEQEAKSTLGWLREMTY